MCSFISLIQCILIFFLLISHFQSFFPSPCPKSDFPVNQLIKQNGPNQTCKAVLCVSGGGTVSDILQEANVTVLSHQRCRNELGFWLSMYYREKEHMCFYGIGDQSKRGSACNVSLLF